MKSDYEFWRRDSKGIIIEQSKLSKFLEEQGFGNLSIDKKDKTKLVRIENNRVKAADEASISRFVLNHVRQMALPDVEEKLTRGISSYVCRRKLSLLEVTPSFSTADTEDTVWFYFENTAVKVTATGIMPIKYEDLPHLVWEERIIKRDFKNLPSTGSDFQQFCLNISGGDVKRFEALESIIGYLLSTYKDPSNPKAIIFVDEMISTNGTANGGTGKSMLGKAIAEMRNLAVVEGKKYNPNNPFRNQRFELSTDVISFDDMGSNFSLEDLFSMLTSGMSVNKKFQQEIYIEPEDAPKMMVSSNYMVKGPGGNADLRRRHEFEVAPHYGATLLPINDFGKLFFNQWMDNEWQNFFSFMIGCAQIYLAKGLLAPKPINLAKNRLISETSEQFVKFIKHNYVINKEVDKRALDTEFEKQYQLGLSAHAFKACLETFAQHMGLDFPAPRSSGGRYYIKLMDKKPDMQAVEEEEGNNLQGPE